MTLNPVIQLRFSEEVHNVDANSVSLHAGSPDGALVGLGQATLGPNNTYAFNVLSRLQPNTHYYLLLSSAIRDTSGNALANTQFSFTTGVQASFTVNLITPNNNDHNVSQQPVIKVMFNSGPVSGVTDTTVTLHLGSPNGSSVPLTNFTAGPNNTFSFQANSALQSSSTYYLVLSAGISNADGTALSPAVFHFTTGAPVPVAIPGYPTPGKKGVSTLPAITVGFSETVQNVSNSTVTLHEGTATGPAVPLTPPVAGANQNYTFHVGNALKYNTQYVLVLSNAITSSAQATPLATTEIPFTTKAGPAWSQIGDLSAL